MKKNKNQNGITLIALVISIIVILILAGIGIGSLTGQNGIVSQAKKAKSSSGERALADEIDLALLTLEISTLEEIDKDSLNTELSKINGATVTYSEAENKFTVSRDGYAFKVDLDGNVTTANGVFLNSSSLKLMKGDTEKLEVTKVGLTDSVTWTSSDPSVATVSNGLVTAVGTSGTATITAKCGSYTATSTVTIVQKVTSITLNKTGTVEVEQGDSLQLEATTTPATNVENVKYSSSDTSGKITVDEKTGLVTVTEDATVGNTATITVKGEKTETVSATVTIKVIQAKLPIGDFVEYDVSYTDMYSDTDLTTDGLQPYTFTKADGWRILDPGTKNADGTYSNAKIISTGIPAKLYYDYNQNIGNTNNGWWGTTEQVAGLYDKQYSKYSESGYDFNNGGHPNCFAATGLFKNFSSIPLTGGATSADYNKGYYTCINNLTTATNGSIFVISSVANEVHNLTLEELNRARYLDTSHDADKTLTATTDADTGLFYLRNLVNKDAKYGYSSSISPDYWLASLERSLKCDLKSVSSRGYINDSSNITYGVRPVVSLKSKIQKGSNGIWKIVE